MNKNIVSLDARRSEKERVYVEVIGEVANDTGTRPFLCSASDGNEYWCKRFNNDHGIESTINEVAASVIGRRIDAHIRPWKIIYVPDSLVGKYIGSSTQGYRLPALPLFGSLNLHTGFLHQDPQTIPFVTDDANFNHVPKLVALWALCNVQQDLQFLSDSADDHSLWSIDHGFWFDSHPRPWQFAPLETLVGRTPIPLIREAMPTSGWDKAIESLNRLDNSLKKEISNEMPIEWRIDKANTDKLVDYVLSRKDYTRGLLEDLKQKTKER
ncbi:HipA family kinase [Corynebacterium sp. HMSC077D03]|uniref:HipA family kinase n=1 Tax=Corynebacterium sp. HMSC077D03 TaxID=1739392 RepID=UPI0008A2D451|nr:HipA family kinase [Corynebacterium sp. HMSC077D03]OFR40946.1 hypothetical protein HMPREF2888_04095 [Corynebacterium sp. HMSC077D03]